MCHPYHQLYKLIHDAQFCLYGTYLRFNFSESTDRTNINLGTIDHLPEMNVIKGIHDAITTLQSIKKFLICISRRRKIVFCLNKSQTPIFQLTTKFHFFVVKSEVAANASLHILFSAFSQKLLILYTR